MRFRFSISLNIILVLLTIFLGLLSSCASSEAVEQKPENVNSVPLITSSAPTTTTSVPTVLSGSSLFPAKSTPAPIPSITPGLTSISPSVKPTSVVSSSPTGQGGKLHVAGKFNVLELHGNYYQMGSQYGSFLKNELVQLYPAIVDNYLIQSHKLTMNDIKSWVDPRYALYPENIKQFIQGAAKTTGIELEKLIILSDLTDLARITPGNVGCSSISTWGQYTSGGPLVFGRNFDWWGHYKNFSSYITVTVFNPDDGSIPFASVGWVGEMLVQTALNSKGLFIESNDGEISGGPAFLSNVIHPSMLSHSFMTSPENTTQLETVVNSSHFGRAMTLSVADKNGALAYECTPTVVRKRGPDAEGLLVATNHFVGTAWTGLKPANDALQTETRRTNLINLANKNKGKINPQIMMQVLDTPIKQGGATQPDTTVYQVIAVPEQLKLWLKAPGYSEWVEIDLSPYFSH